MSKVENPAEDIYISISSLVLILVEVGANFCQLNASGSQLAEHFGFLNFCCLDGFLVTPWEVLLLVSFFLPLLSIVP